MTAAELIGELYETISTLNRDRGWNLTMVAPARFGEILEGRDRTKASATAPACGLYLEHVDYGEAFPF